MGTQDVTGDLDAANLRLFIKHLLDDLRALEAIIAGGAIEAGVRRIGAEQELFMVDRAWRPAPLAMEILAAIDDPHFTTELGRFNLEINLDPLVLGGDCLSRLESDLGGLLAKVRAVAHAHGAAVVLTGMPPDAAQVGSGADQHDAQAAIPRPERRNEPAARRRLRVSAQRIGRVDCQARLGDARSLLHEFSSPLPGRRQ